ncbi:MAG: DUF2304 domain-containing protein [Anaerolineales bacterium]|nr:DUF2304 domain-containing protein [Anaerolineales bacterium]
MTPIQFLLIFVALAILFLYLRHLRTRLLDRMLLSLLALGAVILVVRPDWATALAQLLGVGRGADLVFYLGLSGLAFLWMGLYSRQREMDVRLTELARRMAIFEGEKPKSKPRKPKAKRP